MNSRDYNYDSLAESLLNFAKNLVVKNETRAKENETEDSARLAGHYIFAYEGLDKFESYSDWTYEEFVQVGMTGDVLLYVSAGLMDIPDEYKPALLEIRRNQEITFYEERNNYYRMLHGLPDYGTEPIMTSFNKPVTELTQAELFKLELGELDELKKEYPHLEYLNYLGDRSIDYYTARKANNYDILYYQKYILEEEQTAKFIEFFYQCRYYVTIANYSKAFKHMYYYDAFVILLILFMAMHRYINELYNFAINKDFFSLEDIKNTFLSYGLPFFPEIPLKYQRNIAHNINRLLQYKGTDKVLVDIVKLFGFNNVELYRYYLVKDFKRDVTGDPIIDVSNLSASYDLKFAQVPFNSTDISEALQNTALYQKYEEVIAGDPFWGYTADESQSADDIERFKKEILEQQFNYLNTKYIAVNTMFDVSKNMLDLCYFFNLINTLQENKNLETLAFINKDIKPSANKMKLFDIIAAIYSLICKKLDFEDNIVYSATSVASIYNFNFDKSIDDLLMQVEKVAKVEINGAIVDFDIKNLKNTDIISMELEDGKLYTKNDLIDKYFNNINYRDHLIERMNTTDNYLEFKALQEIYRYNMISDTMAYGYGSHTSYMEYIQDSDPELYEYIVANTQSTEPGNLDKTINNLLYAIETFLSDPRFDDMFSSLSSLSGDIVKEYLLKMINVFKAYTVEIKKINVYFVFDERIMNTIRFFSFLYKQVDTIKSESLSSLFDYFVNMEKILNLNNEINLDEEHTLQVLRKFIDVEIIDKIDPSNPNEMIKDAIKSLILRLVKTKFDINILACDAVYESDNAEMNGRDVLDRMVSSKIEMRLYDKFDFDDSRSYF